MQLESSMKISESQPYEGLEQDLARPNSRQILDEREEGEAEKRDLEGGGRVAFVGTLAAEAPGARGDSRQGKKVEWWQGAHLGQVPRGTEHARRYSRAGGLHQSRGMPRVAGGERLVMEVPSITV